MGTIVAFCGLVCTECEAYIATVANDVPSLEKMAAQARAEYGVPNATADSIRCMGCLAIDGPQCGYCYECAVRACGVERNVPNCAHCADYGCGKLESFWGPASKAKASLDAIRASLVA